MSHLAPDRAPAQELCRGGQRLGDTALFPAGSPHGSAPLALPVHPYYSKPCWRGGLSLLCQGSRDRPGPSPGSAGLQTSRDGTLALQPLHVLARKAHRMNSQRLPHLLPQAVSPRRGVSLFGPSRSPTKVQGAGSVRRAGPQFPAWHYLRRVAPVSIPR